MAVGVRLHSIFVSVLVFMPPIHELSYVVCRLCSTAYWIFDEVIQQVFVADDLEQVRRESAASFIVRLLRVAFASSVAQRFPLIVCFLIHPQRVMGNPRVVNFFHIIIIEGVVVARVRRAAQVVPTLLLDDAQELLQLFCDVRSNKRYVATVRPSPDVRHFVPEHVSCDPFEHILQGS